MAETKIVGATAGGGALSGVRATWNNPQSRRVLILSSAVAAVVVIITGVSLSRSQSQTVAPPETVKLAAPPVVHTDVTRPVSENYRQMVNASDQKRADAAVRSDLDMALPSITSLPQGRPAENAVLPPHVPQGLTPPTLPATTPPVAAPAAPAAPAGPTQEQLDAATRSSPAYNAMAALLGSVAQRMNPGGPFAIVRSSTTLKEPAVAGGGTRGAGVPGAGGTRTGTSASTQTVAKAPARVLIRGGTTAFAVSDTAVNTDYSGPVVATLLEGPHKGAKLVGVKTLEHSAVVLRYTSLSLPSGGPSIPITAYAINLGDVNSFGTTGLQGDVDYHAMQRYVLPALLAFAQTYGLAASMASTSITTTPTSSTVSRTPLTPQDRLIAAVGGATAPLAGDLARQAKRPVTVTLPAQTEIGILFATDVTDKHQEAAERDAANGRPAAGAADLANMASANTGPANAGAPNAVPGARTGPLAGGSVYEQPGFNPRSGYTAPMGGYTPGIAPGFAPITGPMDSAAADPR